MSYILNIAVCFLFSFESLLMKLYIESRPGTDINKATGIFNVYYGVVIGLVNLMLNGFQFSVSRVTAVYGIVNAIALYLFLVSMIQAGNRGSYAFMMICAQFGGIVLPALYNAVFLKIAFSPWQILCIVIILAAFVLMNLQTGEKAAFTPSYLTWCGILFVSNGLYSALLNAQQVACDGAERAEMIMTTYFVMALLCIVLQFGKGFPDFIKGFLMPGKSLLMAMGSCVSSALGVNLMTYLLGSINATVLFAGSYGGTIVLSILYSILLFRERPRPVQVLGMALATGGIIVLNMV